jgi:hypothetical protein
MSDFDTADKEGPGWRGEPKWSYLKKSDASTSMEWGRSKEWLRNMECIGGWCGRRLRTPYRRSANGQSGADRNWDRWRDSSMKYWRQIGMHPTNNDTQPIGYI